MSTCGLVNRGLDNKVTVYSITVEEDVAAKKKTVGTHTSYMSCCTFPNSDQQASLDTLGYFRLLIIVVPYSINVGKWENNWYKRG